MKIVVQICTVIIQLQINKLWASLKTFLFLSFGEELKGEVKIKYRFLEMPLYDIQEKILRL